MSAKRRAPRLLTIQPEVSADGVAVVRVDGTIDSFTVASFRQALADLISSEDLVIDLARLSFIDSAGLGALVGVIRRVRESGGQVAIACSSPLGARVLKSAGLDRLVLVVESIEAATAVLRTARDRNLEGEIT